MIPRRAARIGSAVLAAALLGWVQAGASAPRQEAAPAPRVLRLSLEEATITPITAGWVEDAIAQAEEEGASCLLIVLDTPGGLLDATRAMVKAIVRARVPVIVHVPAGGRAASAGLFITLSAHVAAMAPGSNIGAAHPVSIGGLPTGPGGESAPGQDGEPGDGGDAAPQRSSSPMEDKAVNDTTAWARALAELRGRNAAWAERAVTESLSVSAEEAAREGLVDLVARDAGALLEAVDGREVELLSGPVVLRTRGARIVEVETWWGQGLLAALANPNVAFLLMMLGFYGLLFELYSPGWGVAGVLGTVLLVLGLFGLSYLPVNYAGLLLIALALGMFVAEAFVTSFGMLAVGGAVCLVIGALMLVDSPEGFERVSLAIVVPVAVATAGIAVFLVSSVVRSHRGRVRTGEEALLDAPAEARGAFAQRGEHWTGTVHAHGELWSARSSAPVQAGQSLRVRGRDGLTLLVEPPADDPGDPA